MNVPGIEQRRVVVNEFDFNVYIKPSSNDEGTLVLHHGIGSSALTFARLCQEIYKLNSSLGILCYDARYHGRTKTLGSVFDLSLQAMSADLELLIQTLLSKDEKLLLLGHSMGGTVVSSVSQKLGRDSGLRGLIVVDAVEGYARQALSSMSSLLALWPEKFSNLSEAVNWHLHSGHLLRDRTSAEISVPGCLQKEADGSYSWVLNLRKTKPFWDTWFDHLDEYFLASACARMLVLPGTMRLDTDLTRAQMQGKFQMVIFTDSGHFVQEDVPLKLAESVCHFWARNGHPIKFIPKFGQLRQD